MSLDYDTSIYRCSKILVKIQPEVVSNTVSEYLAFKKFVLKNLYLSTMDLSAFVLNTGTEYECTAVRSTQVQVQSTFMEYRMNVLVLHVLVLVQCLIKVYLWFLQDLIDKWKSNLQCIYMIRKRKLLATKCCKTLFSFIQNSGIEK